MIRTSADICDWVSRSISLKKIDNFFFWGGGGLDQIVKCHDVLKIDHIYYLIIWIQMLKMFKT